MRALLVVCALLVACTGAAAAEPRAALGAGDTIRITVFQNPDLSLEARLSERGTIAYPLLGEIALAGRTPLETGAYLARELCARDCLRDPQVSVSLLQLRSRQVSVLGEVARPGRYALEDGSTRLTDLLALAGGIAPGGGDEVVVTSRRDGEALALRVDVPAMMRSGERSAEPELQPGDTVYVPRAPVFYVSGEVQRAGAYRLEPGLRVMNALSLGGGLSPRGTERAPRIHRRMPDGSLRVLEARLTDPVQAGDLVYFRESLF
ncbi:MAG TPA: polysaccharide export protein EpsE [Burkholderiales bacterium]|nr:polysaccharide export protein EpsE [Burkholderiales bacterium]